MSYPVFYKSKAKSEVKSAISWYENQRRGLGFEFLTDVTQGASMFHRFHRWLFTFNPYRG